MAILDKSDDSSQFENLLELVGEPSSKNDIKTQRFYDFNKFGIILNYDISLKRFWAISFMFDTAGIRAGEMRRYQGKLPMGLEWTDSCSVAERKFGIAPESAKWIPGCQSSSCDAKSRASDYWQSYVKASLHYTLIFESAEGGLGFVSVSTPGWWNEPRKPDR